MAAEYRGRRPRPRFAPTTLTSLLGRPYMHETAFRRATPNTPNALGDGDSMRRLATIVGALMMMLGSAVTTSAIVAPLIHPEGIGSQLIFYFDTREGFTTFANISNAAVVPVFVKVDFWTQDFGAKTTQLLTLSPSEQRVIDVGNELKVNQSPAQQGIAVATTVDESGNAMELPFLSGNFTVANLATGSA